MTALVADFGLARCFRDFVSSGVERSSKRRYVYVIPLILCSNTESCIVPQNDSGGHSILDGSGNAEGRGLRRES